MAMLNEEQQRRAVEVMQEWLAAPASPDGSSAPIDRL